MQMGIATILQSILTKYKLAIVTNLINCLSYDKYKVYMISMNAAKEFDLEIILEFLHVLLAYSIFNYLAFGVFCKQEDNLVMEYKESILLEENGQLEFTVII